jgi:two-component system sensor histidine kinase PilS (NtrC family)
MARKGHPGSTSEIRSDVLRRRLVHLMVGRLVLCVGILVIAVLVTKQNGAEEMPLAERGLYATVAFAFLATIVFAALLGRVRRMGRLGTAQIIADVGIVTALVACTGGVESVFGFLYVPITVSAALLLGRRGAYAASGLAALAYGSLLLLPKLIVFGDLPPRSATPIELVLFGVHAGGLLLVALLASALSHERDRVGDALDQRTRALRYLQRLHERTVESLTSGLLTTDPIGRITTFNPEAERITGMPANDVLGRLLGEVIPGAPEFVQRGHNDSDRAERARLRLRFRNANGEDLHLGIAGSVLRSAGGEPAGHVVIFQDVTKVVEMESELRRQERLAAVGALSAHLAHEIRNPLAAISGSIQILEGSLGPDPESDENRRLIGIAVRETDRLDQLITNFLQYARPAPNRPGCIAIAAVIDEVLEMFGSVRPPAVAVSHCADAKLHVLADEGQLRQLLWNLLLNAVQAMPDGGQVSISAAPVLPQARAASDRSGSEEGARWVEIEVTDTGAGIPEDVLDHIFDPFFTTKKGGTGLGLATVHRIVESSGGHLAVESALGRGTTFRVRLPYAEAV